MEQDLEQDETPLLLAQANEMLADIARIKEQLARARSDAATNGKYADTDWFQSAQRALRHKQREHQEILARVGQIRRERQQKFAQAERERIQGFDRIFRQVAKEMLDEESYLSLIREADVRFNRK